MPSAASREHAPVACRRILVADDNRDAAELLAAGVRAPALPAAAAAVEARLEELLRALPESMRVAVVLRYQEEMLPDEIAKLLGQPVATVKSNLQRGLQLLRRKAAVTMKEYVR